MAYRQLAYLPDRRSTRIEQSVHITVRGLDATRAPYEENISTLAANCHGCRYLSRHEVLRGDVVTLEVVSQSGGGSRCPASARIMSVKRIGTSEMLFEVAVELESAQNIWGIPSPPADWIELSGTSELMTPPRELRIVPRAEAPKTSEPKQARAETSRPPHALDSGVTSSLPPLLVQLVASLREQIAIPVPETTRTALVRDQDKFLREFRERLENEAREILERMTVAAIEDLTRQARILNENYEATARETYDHWMRKLAREIANSRAFPASSSALNGLASTSGCASGAGFASGTGNKPH